MDWRGCIAEVASNLGLEEKIVEESYSGYWKFIKDKIEELPLKQVKTEEEFNQLRTNFNVPYLGKVTCSYKRFLGVKKRLKYLEDRRNGTNKD